MRRLFAHILRPSRPRPISSLLLSSRRFSSLQDALAAPRVLPDRRGRLHGRVLADQTRVSGGRAVAAEDHWANAANRMLAAAAGEGAFVCLCGLSELLFVLLIFGFEFAIGSSIRASESMF